MRKQLILLAGLHKTGTTTVQRTCGKKSQLFKELGILYPLEIQGITPWTGQRGAANHSYLLRMLFKENPPISVSSRDGNAVLLKKLQDRARELFEGFLEQQALPRLLMVAEAVSTLSASELADLKHWFCLRGFDIRLLCCIRSPLSWLNSIVDQRVAGVHGPHLTIRAVIEEFEVMSGIIRPHISNLASVFPDAEFYSFKSAASHAGGPAGYFFDKVGLNIKLELSSIRANRGRSRHFVRIWTLINEEERPPDWMEKGYLNFLASARHVLSAVRGQKFRLRLDELGSLASILVEENEWLKRQFGEEFCDEKMDMSNDLPPLDNDTRARLEAIAAATDPRVRQAIHRYLLNYGQSCTLR